MARHPVGPGRPPALRTDGVRHNEFDTPTHDTAGSWIDDGTLRSARFCRPPRRGHAIADRPSDPRPVRQGHCVAVHRADHPVAAGDQHLPADLDDLSVLHQLPRQPPQCRGEVRRARLVPAHSRRCRRLGRDADHGSLRDLDHRHRDGARLRPRLADRQEIPRTRAVDHHHPDSDDAVAGGGWQFLDVPLPAAKRPVQLRALVRDRDRTFVLPDARQCPLESLGHHHCRCLDVDAVRDADLPGRAALDPHLHL